MGSSREYWLYAKECARWAAETKKQEDQDLFFDMAKAWTNIALVEGDVAKLAAQELPKRAPRLVGVGVDLFGDDDAQGGAQSEGRLT